MESILPRFALRRRTVLAAPMALLPYSVAALGMPHANRLHYQKLPKQPGAAFADFAPLWVEIEGTPTYPSNGERYIGPVIVSPAMFATITRYIIANGRPYAHQHPEAQAPLYLFSFFQGMEPEGAYILPPDKTSGFLDLALPPPSLPSGPNIS